MTSSRPIHSPYYQFSIKHAIQPSDAIIQLLALQPLTSRWLLDADDYHIHSKTHHRLYPPPHAKLSPLKSIIKWPKKSSPPRSLPYHIGNLIFFGDSFIPYAFVDFVDSKDYNSAQRKERVAEFQATIPAETSIPTVQLQVLCSNDIIMPNHDMYPDGLVL